MANYVAKYATTGQANKANAYHISLTKRSNKGPVRTHDYPGDLHTLHWFSTYRTENNYLRKIQAFDLLLNKKGVDTDTIDPNACADPREWFYIYMPGTQQELLFIHSSTPGFEAMSRYYVFEKIEKCTRGLFSWICHHSSQLRLD
jgi:hypothetical protein